jgi:quercetin dioxygenase-like cupin family protein
MHRKLLAATALLATFLLAGSAGAANPGKSEAIVHSLLSQDLPQIPGKEVSMLTVEYLPGGASLPHRHDAEVFVYVLEGSVIMQVDGQKAVTLGPGGTFHEGPNDVHRQSRNASATQPAKFLVFMIKDKDKPATRPVPPQNSAGGHL